MKIWLDLERAIDREVGPSPTDMLGAFNTSPTLIQRFKLLRGLALTGGAQNFLKGLSTQGQMPSRGVRTLRVHGTGHTIFGSKGHMQGWFAKSIVGW
jgi:hypothetical protein